QARRVALLHRLIDERELRGVELAAERLGERALDAVVVDDAPDRREHVPALAPVGAELGEVVQRDDARLVGQLGLLSGAEHVRSRLLGGPFAAREQLALLLQLRGLWAVGEVVGTE